MMNDLNGGSRRMLPALREYKIYFSTYVGATDSMLTQEQTEKALGRMMQESGIQGLTLTPSRGVWMGEWEPSYIATVLVSESRGGHVEALADSIRKEFSQDVVILARAELTQYEEIQA